MTTRKAIVPCPDDENDDPDKDKFCPGPEWGYLGGPAYCPGEWEPGGSMSPQNKGHVGARRIELPNAVTLAMRFHEHYERLAPIFGYQTRPESAVPWADVPDSNKNLMVAVAEQLVSDWEDA